MNTFRRSTCRLNELRLAATRSLRSGALDIPGSHGPLRRLRVAANLRRTLLCLTLLYLISAAPAQDPAGKLPPFLKEFLVKDPPILTKAVKITSAVGPVTGYVARPDTQEKLPAVLLLHDADGLTEWMKLNAREISSIGYVVLAIDLRHRVAAKPQAEQEEKVLAELSAAVRWLRKRPDVFPERIGVVGWSWGAGQALALAAATPLQACVICDGPLSCDAPLVTGLRDTAVLGIFSAPDTARAKELGAFRHALDDARIPHKFHLFPGTKVHFMGPPTRKEYVEEPAEQAWFEIYEFLGKHVEDAGLSKEKKVLGKTKSQATIADIMRAVNQPAGVRGVLIEALKEKPADEQQWKQVRANAVLLAEAGHWLENMKPNKGSETDWRRKASLFQNTASRIVAAADSRDYQSARLALQELGNQCAACHKLHR